jgi:inosine-uridine nucleoside N-ribohydrolase
VTSRVILDCDPGHDDALAILLAAASPEIDLLAITTVAGNQTLAKTTLNAQRVCTLAGITDVPIAAGCDRPLVRPQMVAEDIHGVSGLDGPTFPTSVVETDPRHAVDLIVALVGESAEPITLVPVGPLTNVAMALRREPRVAERLGGIVMMGGAIGIGNTTPAAEFNVAADPEAARIVVESGVPLTIVPLEVTHRAAATEAVIARIAALGTPLARASVELLRFFAASYERVFGFPDPPLHDPCAVAAVIDASIVSTRPMHVEIDTSAGPSYGRTVCDVHGVLKREPNARVGVDLDVERYWDLVIEALATYR